MSFLNGPTQITNPNGSFDDFLLRAAFLFCLIDVSYVLRLTGKFTFLSLDVEWNNGRWSLMQKRIQIVVVVFCSMILLLALGCANWRLPQIDPSGRSLFLPSPNYTTMNTGEGYPQVPYNPSSVGRALGIPGPVFPAAERPESCPDDFLAPNEATAQIQEDCGVVPSEPSVPRFMNAGSFRDPYDKPDSMFGGGWEREGRVSLKPRRVVAPVGSEVILVGGVCDPDGYYCTREDVEWALQKGSVGTFAEPGNSAHGVVGDGRLIRRLFTEPLPELLSNDYALGCTSKKVQVLTRGTPEPNDDVFVLNGQAWIGVTSAREGNSYVNLFAPNLNHQNNRKAASVIHWVDGKWTLPARIAAKTDAPQTLTTVVRRQLTDDPVSNWVVRYEITDGPPATFPGGKTVQEVRTDSSGKATVQLIPTGVTSGTNQIKVQVIRPTTGRGEPDRLIIGQGYTSVSWNNSSIEIRLSGPKSVSIDQQVDYVVEVRNTGNVRETGLVVKSLIPAGLEFVESQPRGQISGSAVITEIGELNAGETKSVTIVYQARESGTVRHCVTAQSDNVDALEDCISTEVTQVALRIDMEGPAADAPIEVGQIANYKIMVINQGRRAIRDIVISDQFDAGLRYRSTDPNQPDIESPISRPPVEILEPEQSIEFNLNFLVVAPGRQCHTVEATARGSEPASVEACIRAVERARSQLDVDASGPAEMAVGDRESFFVELKNSGDTTLSNLEVVFDFDNSLSPTGAAPEAKERDGVGGGTQVVWMIRESIAPGTTKTLEVQCEALIEVPSTTAQVFVRGPNDLDETADFSLEIFAQNENTADGGDDRLDDAMLDNDLERDTDDNSLRDDDRFSNDSLDSSVRDIPTETDSVRLEVSIQARRDRRMTDRDEGNFVDYLIMITNNDEVYDSDIQLDVLLPPELKLERFTGPTRDGGHSSDWRTLQMIPVATLRNGETVKYLIRTRVLESGEATVRAEVRSLRNRNPIIRENKMLVSP